MKPTITRIITSALALVTTLISAAEYQGRESAPRCGIGSTKTIRFR